MFKIFIVTILALLPSISNANNNRIANQITPQVGQKGTEVTVLIEGNNLSKIKGILSYSKGIRFVKATVPTEKIYNASLNAPRDADPNREVNLTLSIDKNCRIGEHLFRIRTEESLSELLSIWVTPFPCIREDHPYMKDSRAGAAANNIENAQQIELNTTFWGHFPAYTNFDEDCFKIDLKKGERITAEVWGACFSSPIDASLTFYGPNKKVLFTTGDTTLRDSDPFATYIAKEAGTHYVVIHPFNDDENTLGHYAIHFTNRVRPKIAYPLGGQAGTSLKTTLIGDPTGDIQAQIRLPKKTPAYEAAVLDYYHDKAVIPLHLKVADFPNVLENNTDHNTEETAQVYNGNLPIAFNGKIESENETDWYRFSAKAGKRYLIRTYAGTCGSPLDPIIQIRPASGNNSKINIVADDSKWNDHDLAVHGRWHMKDLADPIVVFEPDVDGDYLLSVSDNQRLFGPDFVYRVEIQPAQNRFWLHNVQDFREHIEKREAVVLHSGSSIERTFHLIRPAITDYDGEFDIVVKGLPRGVTFIPLRISKNDRVIQLMFNAKRGTPPWSGFPEIELKPVDKDVQLDGGFVLVQSRLPGRGGLCSGFYRITRKFAFSVVNPAPFRVRVAKPSVGLAQNAFLDLDVKIDRSSGYKGPIILRSLWTPNNITSSPPLTVAAGEDRAVFRLTANERAAAKKYPFTLTAYEATGGVVSTGLNLHHVSSTPIEYEVVAPYLSIKLARTAIERGKKGIIKGTIKHVRPLPGPAVATLKNLPTGVELVKDIQITAGMKEISFEIRATSEALLGQAAGINCLITIKEKNQAIVQSSGSATLRIDEERK